MPLTEEQLEQFPESTRDWDEVKNSDSPEQVWDRISHMRSKFGTGLFKPGEDAGEEQKSKFLERVVELTDGQVVIRPDLAEDADEEVVNLFYRSLGRPDNPDDYEFEEIEGSEYPSERQAFIRRIAHEAGLTKNQLKILDKKMRTAELEAETEKQEVLRQQLVDLKAEWGLSFDERVRLANKVAKTFFPGIPEDQKLTAGEIKAFYNIGKQLGENSPEGRDHLNDDQGNMSPDEASAKIAEIRGNPEHPYFDSSKPGHQAARRKMRDLYKIKNGQQP